MYQCSFYLLFTVTKALEINPTIYPLKEFNKKIKEHNPFISEVIAGPKIWLMGEENKFEKMVK